MEMTVHVVALLQFALKDYNERTTPNHYNSESPQKNTETVMHAKRISAVQILISKRWIPMSLREA